MRHRPIPRTVAASAIGLVLTAGVGATAASAAPQATSGSGECVVFKDLPETVLNIDYDDVAPEGPSPGDFAVYDDEMRDANGKVVATVHGTGRVLYNHPSNGHPIVIYEEQVKFTKGGRARAIGVVDIAEMLGGGTAVVGMVGTAGKYQGWRGTREWVVISSDLATVTMTLCPDSQS